MIIILLLLFNKVKYPYGWRQMYMNGYGKHFRKDRFCIKVHYEAFTLLNAFFFLLPLQACVRA